MNVPDSLRYMRMIGNGFAPPPGERTPVWKVMLGLWQSDQKGFVAGWHKAEMEFERLCAEEERLKEQVKSDTDLGGDEGTEAALQVLDRVLKELTGGGGG